jgi:hypothetical protein
MKNKLMRDIMVPLEEGLLGGGPLDYQRKRSWR